MEEMSLILEIILSLVTLLRLAFDVVPDEEEEPEQEEQETAQEED